MTKTRGRRELTRWRNAIFMLFFVSGLGLASWVSRIPTVRDDLALRTDQVGLLIFGLSAGSILGLVAAVWLLSAFGARRALVISIATSSAGLVLVGAAATVWGSSPIAFAALALVGFGMGSTDVMMNVEGAAVERELGVTLMPLLHACFSLGTVAGALLGAGAAALAVSVVWHLSLVAALALAAAAIAVRFVPLRPALGDPADQSAAHTVVRPNWAERMRTSLAVWRDPSILLIGVIVLGMTFAEGSASDWLALAVVDGHGQSDATGALVFGVFVSAMTVGRVLGGPVLDRFGRVPVLRACSVLGVAGLLLVILAPAIWLLIVGTVLWGLGASLGFPVGMSAAADDTANAAARVSAVAMIGYFAFLVGPPVLGLIGEQWGILNALFVIVVLMALAGLAAPAARERTQTAAAG
ncbi:MFS family permease [Cryobacterium sp. MP_3.1]|uniref:MFS transporter n=1 Tax=Cryobacterium zongtaii TaxID=1259217 RepID=A0A2S3ZPD8_9MICO|nr:MULTISPECIES: MFS transporter [Cryobacterium]MEC5184224.1 MFS family permease [Cryobacterium sp. MP_3.1]POH71071.1 MFS transporter [Cryobacterium zongtaii]